MFCCTAYINLYQHYNHMFVLLFCNFYNDSRFKLKDDTIAISYSVEIAFTQ